MLACTNNKYAGSINFNNNDYSYARAYITLLQLHLLLPKRQTQACLLDATGQDANGYYKDVRENGNIVRYRDVMITDSNRRKVYRGWLASDVQNGRMNNGNSMPLNTIIDAQGVPHNVMPWSIN